MKRVAIVVPLSRRSGLTPDERISLRHLTHFLGHHDKFVVAPDSLPVDFPGFGVRRFPDSYFGSVEAHTRLLFSDRFYGAFSDYEYILIYHLDALVFSDQLLEWCDRGFDMIGAPWFSVLPSTGVMPEGKAYGDISTGAGNGGFALRRVQAFRDVLRSRRWGIDPKRFWERMTAGMPLPMRLALLPLRWSKHIRAFNTASWEARRHWADCEDLFFAHRGPHYAPGFKVAPVTDALKFSFEVKPRRCFELNDYKLPFGCHAWPRYDRAFWEPYLLPDPAGEERAPAELAPAARP